MTQQRQAMANSAVASADAELRFWLSVTRQLPRIKGAGKVGKLMRRCYCRKSRHDIEADVLGFKMLLDPSDSLEGELLFAPQLYDRREVSLLREHLKPGHTFVDGGANVGFYSLTASHLVGPNGTVLAIEADPNNASRLKTNIELNKGTNVRLVNAGLSDKTETLRLGLNTSGNRSGKSFLYDGPDAVNVPCQPLLDILNANGIRKIDGAKFDIEGFEFRVLRRFFQDATADLWPRFIIVEHNAFFAGKTGGDTLELLTQSGYRIERIDEINYFASR
jgi:FkbM family methyltransferase